MDLRGPSWSFAKEVSIYLGGLISYAATMHFCMTETALRQVVRKERGGRRERGEICCLDPLQAFVTWCQSKLGEVRGKSMRELTTIWVASLNVDLYPKVSCCCLLCEVHRKLPFVSRVFSCNHCITSV